MDFRLPELGEGVYEAELVAWLVKPGDAVKRGQNLMEVMTDKATMEVPSPFAGTITRTAGRAGPADQGRRGRADLHRPRKRQLSRSRPAPPTPRRSGPAASRADGDSRSPAATTARRLAAPDLPVKAAPSVRYMARKLGIDLAQRARQRPRRPHPDRGPVRTGASARQRPTRRRPLPSRARLRHARHAHQAAGPAAARSPSTWSRPSAPSRITATWMSAT